jgi:uncharacterized protein YfiM (DUF2279 family)
MIIHMLTRWWVNTILFLMLAQGAGAQQNFPDTLNRKKLAWLIGAEGALYAGTMSGLYFIWYDDQDFVPMHSFADGDEWLQMDKAGHFMTASVIADHSAYFYRLCGVSQNKAALFGAGQSFFYLTSLEIMDGFSKGWGFSWSDMLANAGGNLFFLAQELAWKDQRLIFKFSAHTTANANWRPELLGEAFTERIMKDYNGQTYWLGITPGTFMRDSKFPAWLTLAFGYGADGMLGGKSNPEFNEEGIMLPSLERRRQFYFSLDADLTKIPVEKKWLRTTLKLLNIVKIPFPALELSGGEIRFHGLYF